MRESILAAFGLLFWALGIGFLIWREYVFTFSSSVAYELLRTATVIESCENINNDYDGVVVVIHNCIPSLHTVSYSSDQFNVSAIGYMELNRLQLHRVHGSSDWSNQYIYSETIPTKFGDVYANPQLLARLTEVSDSRFDVTPQSLSINPNWNNYPFPFFSDVTFKGTYDVSESQTSINFESTDSSRDGNILIRSFPLDLQPITIFGRLRKISLSDTNDPSNLWEYFLKETPTPTSIWTVDFAQWHDGDKYVGITKDIKDWLNTYFSAISKFENWFKKKQKFEGWIYAGEDREVNLKISSILYTIAWMVRALCSAAFILGSWPFCIIIARRKYHSLNRIGFLIYSPLFSIFLVICFMTVIPVAILICNSEVIVVFSISLLLTVLFGTVTFFAQWLNRDPFLILMKFMMKKSRRLWKKLKKRFGLKHFSKKNQKRRKKKRTMKVNKSTKSDRVSNDAYDHQTDSFLSSPNTTPTSAKRIDTNKQSNRAFPQTPLPHGDGCEQEQVFCFCFRRRKTRMTSIHINNEIRETRNEHVTKKSQSEDLVEIGNIKHKMNSNFPLSKNMNSRLSCFLCCVRSNSSSNSHSSPSVEINNKTMLTPTVQGKKQSSLSPANLIQPQQTLNGQGIEVKENVFSFNFAHEESKKSESRTGHMKKESLVIQVFAPASDKYSRFDSVSKFSAESDSNASPIINTNNYFKSKYLTTRTSSVVFDDSNDQNISYSNDPNKKNSYSPNSNSASNPNYHNKTNTIIDQYSASGLGLEGKLIFDEKPFIPPVHDEQHQNSMVLYSSTSPQRETSPSATTILSGRRGGLKKDFNSKTNIIPRDESLNKNNFNFSNQPSSMTPNPFASEEDWQNKQCMERGYQLSSSSSSGGNNTIVSISIRDRRHIHSTPSLNFKRATTQSENNDNESNNNVSSTYPQKQEHSEFDSKFATNINFMSLNNLNSSSTLNNNTNTIENLLDNILSPIIMSPVAASPLTPKLVEQAQYFNYNINKINEISPQSNNIPTSKRTEPVMLPTSTSPHLQHSRKGSLTVPLPRRNSVSARQMHLGTMLKSSSEVNSGHKKTASASLLSVNQNYQQNDFLNSYNHYTKSNLLLGNGITFNSGSNANNSSGSNRTVMINSINSFDSNVLNNTTVNHNKTMNQSKKVFEPSVILDVRNLSNRQLTSTKDDSNHFNYNINKHTNNNAQEFGANIPGVSYSNSSLGSNSSRIAKSPIEIVDIKNQLQPGWSSSLFPFPTKQQRIFFPSARQVNSSPLKIDFTTSPQSNAYHLDHQHSALLMNDISFSFSRQASLSSTPVITYRGLHSDQYHLSSSNLGPQLHDTPDDKNSNNLVGNAEGPVAHSMPSLQTFQHFQHVRTESKNRLSNSSKYNSYNYDKDYNNIPNTNNRDAIVTASLNIDRQLSSMGFV